MIIPAGENLPATLTPHVVAQRPSEAGLTYVITPMAIHSEGGKRNQYVVFNATPGASETARRRSTWRTSTRASSRPACVAAVPPS